MEQLYEHAAEPPGTRVLAQGGGAGPGSLHVELLQRQDGTVAVSFGLTGDGGAVQEWAAGDIEHGVRTFLSLVRRRGGPN